MEAVTVAAGEEKVKHVGSNVHGTSNVAEVLLLTHPEAVVSVWGKPMLISATRSRITSAQTILAPVANKLELGCAIYVAFAQSPTWWAER